MARSVDQSAAAHRHTNSKSCLTDSEFIRYYYKVCIGDSRKSECDVHWKRGSVMGEIYIAYRSGDQVDKSTKKMSVCSDSVLCLGRINDPKEAGQRWEGPVA